MTRVIKSKKGNRFQNYIYGFGNLVSSSGLVSQPYQYVGKEGYYRESQLDLYLLGQRWYDEEVGRFISRDPIGEEGGLNLYVYVGNNPVNNIDPYGERNGRQSSSPMPEDCKRFLRKLAHGEFDTSKCYSCCEWLFGDPCLEREYLQECYQNCLNGCLPVSGPCIQPPFPRKR